MIVTDIKKQVHNENKYSVFVDYEFVFGLYHNDILYFKLEVGKEIKKETFDFIFDTLVYDKAQKVALDFISYKLRTEKEVVDKLSDKEFSSTVILKVVEFLNKYSYVDDYKYAEAFIRNCLKVRPRGVFLMQMELEERGVSRKIIEDVFAETYIDEIALATPLICKKFDCITKDDYKTRKKAQAFLQRKGFSFDTINYVIDQILE